MTDLNVIMLCMFERRYVAQKTLFVMCFAIGSLGKCIYTCIPTYIHAYLHICTHANIHTYVHIYMYTCIHIHIYTYIHIYIAKLTFGLETLQYTHTALDKK